MPSHEVTRSRFSHTWTKAASGVGECPSARIQIADSSQKSRSTSRGRVGLLAVTAAAPLLYAAPDEVPRATCDWLAAHADIETVHIAGGVQAVGGRTEAGDGVEDELIGCADGAVTRRYFGPTRIQTAIAIAEPFFPGVDSFALANAEKWPDAVVGGDLTRAYRTPVLLTFNPAVAPDAEAAFEPELEAFFKRVRQPQSRGFVLGGTGVVSDPILGRFEELMRGKE